MKYFYASISPAFLVIAAIPFLLGIVGVYLPGLGFILFILGIPLLVISLILATSFSLSRGIKRARKATSTSAAIFAIAVTPVMCVLVVLAAWPSLYLGTYTGNLSRLAINRQLYQKIIREARRAQRPDWYAEKNGVTYSVDIGPPVRVAFNPAGFLDNWSAIVFDPSGAMLRAEGLDRKTGEFNGPDQITKLFGGDLVRCDRLWGDYLSCSFT